MKTVTLLSSSQAGPCMPGYVSKQIPGKPALAKTQSLAPGLQSAAPREVAAKRALGGGSDLPSLPAHLPLQAGKRQGRGRICASAQDLARRWFARTQKEG